MTWADYRPIPGRNWADPALKPERGFRLAVVGIDFPGQPFVITMPKGSDPFGNPQIDPVKREDVPRFFADFWMKPGEVNHGQTINGYWMEQSRGKFGITEVESFGPYRMPKPIWAYGLNEYRQNDQTPDGSRADGRMERDCDEIWTAAVGKDIRKDFDAVLRLYASYDETGVWQEFGEMKFTSKEDIPAEWGNPNPAMPRWIPTRYVEWTSWLAGVPAVGPVLHAPGRELGHDHPRARPFRLQPARPQQQSLRQALPARRRRDLGHDGPRLLQRAGRAPQALGRAADAGRVHAGRSHGPQPPREQVHRRIGPFDPGPGRPGEERIGRGRGHGPGRRPAPRHLHRPRRQVRRREAGRPDAPDDPATNPLSAGTPNYSFYTLEVVQRIGYDSFTPDNGVLIAKNKDGLRGRNGGPNEFNSYIWVIDAHPEDIGMVDYVKPNGEKVMRTVADYRQLNDALFHAGLDSGSSYEWEDTPNRLHFYVIDLRKDKDGILVYTLAVRSLDGAGPQRRGVALAPPAGRAIPKVKQANTPVTFTLSNTGAAADPNAGAHFGADVYRMSVSVDGRGWSVRLPNALAAVKSGASQPVTVFVSREAGASKSATVTLRATSESDPSKSATVAKKISR